VAIRKSPAPPPADKESTAQGHASGLDDSAREPITAALRLTRSGVPIPAPPKARPEAVIVDDDPAGDLDVTNPMSPAPAAPEKRRQRGRPGPRTEQLAEWQQALSVVDDEPGASGSRSRPGPETIELLGKVPPADDELEPSSLSPGTLVIGPPPETHPLGGQVGDATVERRMPIPEEGIRPSKRPTRERPVAVPPEAFPDDTEPSVISVGPGDPDDGP
jgi:hypothetical protein